MSTPRTPIETVRFIDDYCAFYQQLFPDVRSFEQFKLLHLGLMSELPRKSLPAISKAVGLDETQSLHHFIANSPWNVAALRQVRLTLTKHALHGRSLTLCIDETGDKKKGRTTDYVARQYIGNLGKIENGMVSVNAYGVIDTITFPLIFKVFKPKKRLKATDTYRTKPELAAEIIHELVQQQFHIDLVLADCLYGESTEFVEELLRLQLQFVVALHRNHGVWLLPGERISYTRWRTFERVFTNGATETRYLREVIYGKRRNIRYYQLTTDPQELPHETTVFLMTNVTGDLRQRLGNLYGLRTWIEYGFKHAKNELGWADYRLTDYQDIERWWELVSSAYLMISLQTSVFQNMLPPDEGTARTTYAQHRWWDTGSGWKHTLNNLRLIIQPVICAALLNPWLRVFDVPTLRLGLQDLVQAMQHYHGFLPT